MPHGNAEGLRDDYVFIDPFWQLVAEWDGGVSAVEEYEGCPVTLMSNRSTCKIKC